MLPMFIIPAAPSLSSHLWLWLVSERRTHQLAATFPTSKHPASSMSMPGCFVQQFVNRTPDFCDFICIFGAESAVSNIRTETGRLVSAQPHYYRHPGTTINRPCNISISNHPHHLATNRRSFFSLLPAPHCIALKLIHILSLSSSPNVKHNGSMRHLIIFYES